MLLARKIRGVLLALVFYGLAGAAVSYFVWHARHGERGLEAKTEMKRRIFDLQKEIAALRFERVHWERRVNLLRAETLDRDILEERVRVLLNAAHKNDVIVILDRSH